MTIYSVTTQDDLDAVLTEHGDDPHAEILIDSPAGACLHLYGSATVRACGSATVRAYDSATVTASRYVAVHIHSQHVTLSGGVVIDTSTLRATRTSDWLDYTGASVDEDDTVHLYKAVDDDLCAGHDYVKTRYPIGENVEPDRWRDDHYCGHGLHACPTPAHALDHYPAATRLIEVTCHRDDLRPIDWTRTKAPVLHVLREVDIQGAPIKPAAEGVAA